MSAFYDKVCESWLKKTGPDMINDTIKCVMVDTNGGTPYTVNLTTHQFLSDIPSGARIATTPALTSKTVTGRVFDAADTSITGVSGTSTEVLVVYQDTGSAATSQLIAYLDSGTTFTPNGGNVNITFDNGANKIFKM